MKVSKIQRGQCSRCKDRDVELHTKDGICPSCIMGDYDDMIKSHPTPEIFDSSTEEGEPL